VVTHSFDGEKPISGIDTRLRIVDVDKLAALVSDAGFTDWVKSK
jgi:hypothetical protein